MCMPPKILVIDDDSLIRELVLHTLQVNGYTVVTASSGQQGVGQFQEEKPDLVVLDVAMPEMSGFAVAERIRDIEQEQSRARTPIIILTAYARSFMATPDAEARIDSYLTKPIDPKKLLKHIRQFLDGEKIS